MIVAFTYFYTYATFNPAEVSNNIKRNGGFVPGIRAGKPTTDYLAGIISKITLFGGIFLAVIAVIPMLLRFTNLNIAFGGTSILIVVGVAVETYKQIEKYLLFLLTNIIMCVIIMMSGGKDIEKLLIERSDRNAACGRMVRSELRWQSPPIQTSDKTRKGNGKASR